VSGGNGVTRFSLGTILVKLKIVSREAVEETARIQTGMTRDEYLGELLVARGLLEREQLELALAAQEGLRSTDRAVRALAAAKLAEISSGNVVSASRTLQREVAEFRRESNHVGWPAVGAKVSK
jgi:hypothetical protein